jgi:N4-(beta-N-acetylglucosaminyl)-L-asparaginase
MNTSPGAATRRTFLAATAAGLSAAGRQLPAAVSGAEATSPLASAGLVRVISSANGLRTTKRAYELICEGNDVLDACVAGVNIVEDDPEDTSVGYGGLPNEEGVVQLDAAVMHGPTHQAGAVAALEGIRYPSRVAKLVMQETDHVLLVGPGAQRFAIAQGFQPENLLTDKSRQIWLRWKQTLSDRDDWLEPADSSDRNTAQTPLDQQLAAILRERPTGTIHCAGIDSRSDISCVTTTSGLAFKISGRVGDSPIVGAGLFVDNAVGSCGSTGRGEANLQNQSSFAVVELMRRGMAPAEAGLEVLRRVAQRTVPRLRDKDGRPDFDLKLYILRKDGLYAGVSLKAKQRFAVTDAQGTRLEDCTPLFG